MKETLIYGIHPVLEALEDGREFDRIFLHRSLGSDEIRRIADKARARCIPVLRVPPEKLDRLSRKTHQGVIALLAPIEYMPLEEVVATAFEQGRAPFVLLLDGLTDVRNFGAVARTAEAAGVDAIVIPERGSVSVTADAVKTSSGALGRVPVCRVTSVAAAIRILKDSGLRIVVASEKAAELHTEVNLVPPIGIVMGAEDTGPSPEALRAADNIAAIPILGSVGSLNVSVAAGIFMYEVVRQATGAKI